MEGIKLSEWDQILILKANTAGPALHLVQRMSIAAGAQPSIALKNIWDALQARWGKGDMVAAGLRDLLSKLPSLKLDDSKLGDKLYMMYEDCLMVSAHMGTVKSLDVLDHAEGLELLRRKLPDSIQRRWRKVGVKYKKTHSCEHPPFTRFCEFLLDEATEFADTSFLTLGKSTAGKGVPVKPPSQEQKPGKSSFLTKTSGTSSAAPSTSPSSTVVATKTDSEKKFCHIHNNDKHSLADCKQFAGLNAEEKMQDVRECEASHSPS